MVAMATILSFTTFDWLDILSRLPSDMDLDGVASGNGKNRTLTHLIHRIFLKVKGIHNSYIMNNGARAISLLARPRFRPYLSGAGG